MSRLFLLGLFVASWALTACSHFDADRSTASESQEMKFPKPISHEY